MATLMKISLISVFLVSGMACSNEHVRDPIQHIVVAKYTPGVGAQVWTTWNADVIALWESCFPRYRDLPSSPPAAGFSVKYEVFFVLGNGLAYGVYTDGINWSNGKGTFRVGHAMDEADKLSEARLRFTERVLKEELSEARLKLIGRFLEEEESRIQRIIAKGLE